MRAQVTIGKGNVERETERAVCFDLGLGSQWMPKSQIEIEWDGDNGTLTMPVWLARDRGLWGFNSYGDTVCTLVDD